MLGRGGDRPRGLGIAPGRLLEAVADLRDRALCVGRRRAHARRLVRDLGGDLSRVIEARVHLRELAAELAERHTELPARLRPTRGLRADLLRHEGERLPRPLAEPRTFEARVQRHELEARKRLLEAREPAGELARARRHASGAIGERLLHPALLREVGGDALRSFAHLADRRRRALMRCPERALLSRPRRRARVGGTTTEQVEESTLRLLGRARHDDREATPPKGLRASGFAHATLALHKTAARCETLAENRGIVGGVLDEVLVLGAGYAGKAVLAHASARGLATKAVVRSAARAEALRGHEVVVAPTFDAALATLAGPSTHVVVAFPPDGATDARVELHAGAITYVSSTSVYGDRRGVVDDRTPVTETPSASAARRLEAESIWRRRGATVLRCPAIYGDDRGLHVRVVRGRHAIPGDGSGFVSRIHVDDLAALILAAPRAPGETFVVGDLNPARHVDVVRWICAAYGAPMPPFVPLADVHETLRADRQINGSRALRVLGVTLRYPSYDVRDNQVR